MSIEWSWFICIFKKKISLFTITTKRRVVKITILKFYCSGGTFCHTSSRHDRFTVKCVRYLIMRKGLILCRLKWTSEIARYNRESRLSKFRKNSLFYTAWIFQNNDCLNVAEIQNVKLRFKCLKLLWLFETWITWFNNMYFGEIQL